MYILFSPSEGKRLGGDESKLSQESLIFSALYEKRLPLLKAYNSLMLNGSDEALHKLTGIKKEAEVEKYKEDLFASPLMKAFERYDGVAYDYLDIGSLPQKQKEYLYKQTIIFSNLFGPLRGGDKIPAYKLKQGSSLDGVATEKVYKKAFSSELDKLFKKELILDLRAGFYEKFYTLEQEFVTMKFLKGGKSVSHWAKAYRGKVLQTLSKVQPQTKQELLDMKYEGLKFIESVPYKKKGTMLIYEVL